MTFTTAWLLTEAAHGGLKPPPHSEDGRAGHMGKRSAVAEFFLGNMGSIQRETRPSIQREDQPTMETQLEQIAAKVL
jgi:hypothetical protein